MLFEEAEGSGGASQKMAGGAGGAGGAGLPPES